MTNKTFKLIVSQITFDSADDLIDAVVRLDNVRLYQTNKPYEDPDQIDVLDGNDMGSGECLCLSYDRQDRTLDITGNGGVCAVMIQEKGFTAGDLVLGMSHQFDFLESLKSYSYNQPDITVTVQVLEDGKQTDERTILLRDYQSKFFADEV
ncbi:MULTISPECIES: hypothetical protein [Acinetobacter]|uniref:Uncharacterized protein n=1 Tax=Acinetobacter indicus TaxID=756892 RepID=A0A6C0Y7H8_9GAMM|nr:MULTISPECIES: hypothetical protein [Acinetobacter]QIC72060.1 hypothetical protein FSC09_17025 [Acinetobacter indicus]QKQ71539.1 hypothetical protein E5Y90_15005 [Acinetobacter sp. 10FS3-1]